MRIRLRGINHTFTNWGMRPVHYGKWIKIALPK